MTEEEKHIMLNVKTPDEVLEIIEKEFGPNSLKETVSLQEALGRTAAEDVCAKEYVPGFDRSSVDGYAIRAKDSFGCSESIPAILKVSAVIEMGESYEGILESGCCASVPTGGKVPEGADCVVMIEYTEKLSEGEVAVIRPAAPGENVVFKGDDCVPGQPVISKGTKIKAQHIGACASLGIDKIAVSKKPCVGIISTGDELVDINETPADGQVRDVNSYALAALCREWGCDVISYGFVKDDEELLRSLVGRALKECDAVLISGGSSVGQKDATARVIESFGRLLFHGIAMKPGKPTILGNCKGRPVVGLPGHPGASFFVASLFAKPIISRLMGSNAREWSVQAVLKETVPANQGRTVYMGVTLEKDGDVICAMPVQSKSGLITSLTQSDGFICIPRDCEGLFKGTPVSVYVF